MVRSYLRQRRGVLLTFLLFGGLFAVTFALYSLPVQAVAYPFLLCAVAGSILLAADYRQALRRHRQMERVLRLPDEIAASLPPADTVEREDYRQLVALLEESRRQIQSQAQRRYGDMVDYYTLWAHQIKTPIASMLSLIHIFTAGAAYDGPMPGKSAAECGNYRNLDAALARACCAFYADVIRRWTPEDLVYPEA